MASNPAPHASIAAVPVGRISRSREIRTALVHAGLCVAGLVPTIAGMSPAWRAAGLGLWFPGAGFMVLGPLGLLATLLCLILFAGALIAWFGSGMVIAPVIIWALGILIAALTAPAAPWPAAPYVVAGLTIGGLAYLRFRKSRKEASDIRVRDARNRFLPGAIAALRTERAPRAAPGNRELDARQLQHLRYVLDRALQPVDEFNGFDRKDQFQTAATRYQINALGYAVGLAQCHYTPSFHGYMSQAQRNLIDKYTLYPVWNYWIYESIWGHLNFTNFDPVGKDNIMLTGFFGIQVGMYMSNTGDQRYLAPGSITFKGKAGEGRFRHDYQDLAASIVRNFRDSAYCLYPCEPNWIYPICNHYGMTAVTLNDRLTGSADAPAILPQWLRMLDSEFSDKKGTPVPLRSSLTGWTPPFPATDGMYVPFANCFVPERAERLWATVRTEMQPLIITDTSGAQKLVLPGAGIDFGNYGKGHGMNYAQFGNAAHEMGDEIFAAALERALDEDCGLQIEGGVARYSRTSNLGNAYAAMSRIQRRDDFMAAVCEGPAPSVLQGPILDEAHYPDVLVAKAFSRGEDLELVLMPGSADGGPRQIGIARLVPGKTYDVSGDQPGSITADACGRARMTIPLHARVALHLVPQA